MINALMIVLHEINFVHFVLGKRDCLLWPILERLCTFFKIQNDIFSIAMDFPGNIHCIDVCNL